MNPVTSREAQIEKHFLKHTPSNPTKHVEYPDVEGLNRVAGF